MPSTYSPNLRIELIANGEQSGTWGTTTNTNLGTLIEDAISGYVSVSITSANQALTAVDGSADQSRNMVINLTTTTSAAFNVYIPPAEKFYVIRNSSAYDATIYCSTVLGNTTAAGTGVTVLAGTTTMIFADGTNVASSLTAFSGNLVVSANSSSPALRVTQTGSGNSILVEDSANPDSTPFVVDANGRIVSGYTAPIALQSSSYLAEFLASGNNFPLAAGYTAASATGPKFTLAKNRSADWSTQTVVQSSDTVGEVDFMGSDGTNIIPAARIGAYVDGTPGTNDMPGRLVFSTTADGASSPTERMRLDSSGNVGIGTISPTQLLDVNGNVAITGSARRITGDFSNATVANRVAFQTSTTNGNTSIGALPNGTSVTANFRAFNNPNPTNSAWAAIQADAGTATFTSGINGTGTYLPMVLLTSNTEKLRIAADATGTYTFGGTAPRITGDFSNATVANRVMFQTSTTNGNTGVFIVPNGTATNSNIQVISASDPTNSSAGIFQAVGGSDIRIQSGIQGTGTYLPMTFYTGGSEKMRILTSTAPSAVLGHTNVLEAYGRSTFSVVHVSGGLVEVGTSGGGRGIMYWDEAGNSLIINGRSTNSSVGLQSVGTGPVTVTTNSLERMRIDSSGNVGIGTISPTFRLDVRGAAAAAGIYAQVVNTDATAGSAGGFIGSASGTNNFFTLAQSVGGTTTLTNSGANALIVQTAQAQPLIFATNATEWMRIDSNGDAAIGGSVASGFRLNLVNNNLGTTAGNVKHSLRLSTTTSNGDYLLFSKYRISNGSDWVTAGWRIQQLVDATYHAYIQFNGNNNEGISFGTGGSSAAPLSTPERMRITGDGNVLVTGAGGGLGYGTGAGGTVTQATNKATAVTLNKPTGRITMNGAALAASTTVEFTFNNSLLAGADCLLFSIIGNVTTAAAYNIGTRSFGAGSCVIGVRNVTAGSLSESIEINFAIIKGATS